MVCIKFVQFIVIFLTFYQGNKMKAEEFIAYIIVGGYVSYLVGVVTA